MTDLDATARAASEPLAMPAPVDVPSVGSGADASKVDAVAKKAPESNGEPVSALSESDDAMAEMAVDKAEENEMDGVEVTEKPDDKLALTDDVTAKIDSVYRKPDIEVAASELYEKFFADGLIANRVAAFGSTTINFETSGLLGEHIAAVGVSRGRENGEDIIEESIGVYFASKVGVKRLKELQGHWHGYRIEYIYAGSTDQNLEEIEKIRPVGKVYSFKSESSDRIHCGSSCGPTGIENKAGTIGCLVKAELNGEMYIVSNNHVLSQLNTVPYGTPILAPANLDGRGGKWLPRTIGQHSWCSPIMFGDPSIVPPTEIDIAIAKCSDINVISSWQGDHDGYDTPVSSIEPRTGMRVCKIGRSSGRTVGVIKHRTATPMGVKFKLQKVEGVYYTINSWFVESDSDVPFCVPGDSGALVVTESPNGRACVGILYGAAGSGRLGLIIPMNTVLNSVKDGPYTLVSGHGLPGYAQQS